MFKEARVGWKQGLNELLVNSGWMPEIMQCPGGSGVGYDLGLQGWDIICVRSYKKDPVRR